MSAGQIDVGQCVAGDHEKRFAGQQPVGHFDRAGRTQRRILDDVVHRDAELGAAVEIRFDLVGEIVQRGDDFGDAMRPQQVDDVLHDRFPGNGGASGFRAAQRGQRP